MCGIAGIIALDNSTADLAGTAKRMNDAIRHRGPDGEGYLLIGNEEEIAAFGNDTPQTIMQSSILHKPVQATECNENLKGVLAHRRLSIIDITATGHQPLCNITKTLWIVFNGEIYNYIELRDELMQLGHKFHTASDTEVVLAAYTEWGYECVNRFNGMWAFVIYDKSKKQLFASRDRFGVKPFYYCKNGKLFAFASEQKALLAAGVVDFKPNEKAVFDYWLFAAMEEEEEGMFKGIYELFPSHSLTLNLETGELKKWKYYTLPYSNNYKDSSFNLKESTEKIQSLFLDSVKLRLRSDVEVASCLSGGVDSSSIVSAIYKLTGKGLNTFTTSFHNTGIDESPWAKIVSDHTHSNAHYTYPAVAELMKDLEDLIYCQDIPIWSTSTYAQFRVMRLIKENGIKVALDGQGGDELFAGYDKYYPYHFKDVRKNGGSIFAEANSTGRARELKKLGMRQAILNKYIYYLPLSLQLKARLKIHPELKYLNRDFLKRNMERLPYKNDAQTLNESLNKDFNNTLLKKYLKCEDRCSMWHSIESRTPFADDINLIEYVFSLPSSVKIMNGELKSLLRKAMRGVTPDAILDRKDKKGYMTPNRQWVAEIRNEVKHLFENPALAEYLDTKSILKDYDALFNQPNKPDDGRIFKLIAFAKWMEIFSKV
jgi:asparagine synthase (glutamine-hydrolysing)